MRVNAECTMATYERMRRMQPPGSSISIVTEEVSLIEGAALVAGEDRLPFGSRAADVRTGCAHGMLLDRER